jgi:hypothetical protein
VNEPSAEVIDATEHLRRHRGYLKRDDSKAEDWRDYLEDLLDAELLAVRQLGVEGDRWQFDVRGRRGEKTVELTLDDLSVPKTFKRKFWRATHTTPRLRGGELDDVCDAIGEAVESEIGEVVDSGLTAADETREWLAAFCSSFETPGACDPSDPEQLHDALGDGGVSFVDPAGRLHLRLRELAKSVHLDYGQRTSHKDLAARLGDLGFERVQHAARPPGGGRERKGRYWVSPPAFDPSD